MSRILGIVAHLNMPDTIEACEEQLRIISYAKHCAFDSDSSNYDDLLSEIIYTLWCRYKALGGSATQIGDIVKWGRKRTLQQIIENDSTIN